MTSLSRSEAHTTTGGFLRDHRGCALAYSVLSPVVTSVISLELDCLQAFGIKGYTLGGRKQRGAGDSDQTTVRFRTKAKELNWNAFALVFSPVKIDASRLKVVFVISTILALVVLGLVVAFEFLGTALAPSQKAIEEELLSSLEIVDKAIQIQRLVKEDFEHPDPEVSQFGKNLRAATIKVLDTEIEKYEGIKKNLVSAGIEILGSGWLSKKSFQAYKVANVLTVKEVSEALRKFGASKKLISRFAPVAWRQIKRANVRAALAAVAATGAVVAAHKAHDIVDFTEGLSLWWKIGLPSGTFVLVFVGFLVLVRLGVLD
jgi:hypothetical protein